jgi:hypothetical protein
MAIVQMQTGMAREVSSLSPSTQWLWTVLHVVQLSKGCRQFIVQGDETTEATGGMRAIAIELLSEPVTAPAGMHGVHSLKATKGAPARAAPLIPLRFFSGKVRDVQVLRIQ